MLWSIVLPAQITFGIMLFLVLISTTLAAARKWRTSQVFFGTAILALVAFIPSCTGIMSILDARRFGVFSYPFYADVKDLRIYSYLPESASDITVEKTAMGHRAKYQISEVEMREFIDRLWKKYGSKSATPRTEVPENEIASQEEIDQRFGDLGWPSFSNAIRFESPRTGNGAGAEYYLDNASGTVYHRAGYW